MVRLAVALNIVALILTMSVIVVVVSLTVTLETSTTRINPRIHITTTDRDSVIEGIRLLNQTLMSLKKESFAFVAPPTRGHHPLDLRRRLGSDEDFKIFRETDNSSEQQMQRNTDSDQQTTSQSLGQMLALSPLFLVTSLFGMSASQKLASTGTIVCYWITLTLSLLISIYVTSGIIEYEQLFDWENKSSSVDTISRLIVLIGGLQMLAAAVLTIAKYNKTRVAVKDQSISEMNQNQDMERIRGHENVLVMTDATHIRISVDHGTLNDVQESSLDANLGHQLHRLTVTRSATSSPSLSSSSGYSSSSSSSPFPHRHFHHPPHHHHHHRQRVMIRELIPAPTVTLIQEREEPDDQ